MLLVGREGEVVSLRFGAVLQVASHCVAACREDLLYDLLASVHQEDGGLTEYSPVEAAKLYFLCLHLGPAWNLSQLEADILTMLGVSREVLSRSAPTRPSPLAATEDIKRNVRR